MPPEYRLYRFRQFRHTQFLIDRFVVIVDFLERDSTVVSASVGYAASKLICNRLRPDTPMP